MVHTLLFSFLYKRMIQEYKIQKNKIQKNTQLSVFGGSDILLVFLDKWKHKVHRRLEFLFRQLLVDSIGIQDLRGVRLSNLPALVGLLWEHANNVPQEIVDRIVGTVGKLLEENVRKVAHLGTCVVQTQHHLRDLTFHLQHVVQDQVSDHHQSIVADSRTHVVQPDINNEKRFQ